MVLRSLSDVIEYVICEWRECTEEGESHLIKGLRIRPQLENQQSLVGKFETFRDVLPVFPTRISKTKLEISQKIFGFFSL